MKGALNNIVSIKGPKQVCFF